MQALWAQLGALMTVLTVARLGVERAAQQEYDFKIRELGYRTDPMNVLPQRILGEQEFNKRLEMRIGTQQMAEARGRWRKG